MDNHFQKLGEDIGYLKGRLDGHEGRITQVEAGYLRIENRLCEQDKVMDSLGNVLAEIKILISRWVGIAAGMGGFASAICAYAYIASQAHWWPFK